MISVPVFVAVVKPCLFLLILVKSALQKEYNYFYFSKLVVWSFGVCLQINCMVTKDHGTHCFLNWTQCLWTGTHDFSQDESQDSP